MQRKGGEMECHIEWLNVISNSFNVKESLCLGLPRPVAIKCVRLRHDISLKIPMSRQDNAVLRGIRLTQLSHHHHPLQQVSLGTWPECNTNVDVKYMKSKYSTCACHFILNWLKPPSSVQRCQSTRGVTWKNDKEKEGMLWRHSFLNMNIYGLVFLHVQLTSDTWFGGVFSKWD